MKENDLRYFGMQACVIEDVLVHCGWVREASIVYWRIGANMMIATKSVDICYNVFQ